MRDGSLSNPYIDLRDAILKAEDLASDKIKAFITIHLTKG